MNYPEANYEQFQINTNDIWNYEKRCYHYPSRLSDSLIDRLIELLEREIPKHGSPFVTPQEEGDPHFTYWKSVIKRNQLNSEKPDPFEVDEFRTNKGFYSYDSPVEILKDNEEFDFCFALKMRQYEGKLLKLDDFLNFHFNQNFSGDQVQFNKFLKLITMQFNDSFLSSKIVSVVEDYIMNCREISKPKSMNKALRTVRNKSTNFDSFLIKSDLEGFKNHPMIWTELLKELQNNRFIHSSSKAKSLKRAFSNEIIAPNERAIWIGSIKEMQWFIHYFVKNDLIEPVGNEIWVITAKSFVRENNLDFTPTQLVTANGKNLYRKDKLYKILDRFFGLK